jgi:hypothetical protein
VDKKRYNTLKKAYSSWASWALWNPDNPYDPSYIEDHINRLQTRFVFVGLNASKDLKGQSDWRNYHYKHPGSREWILSRVFTGSPYEGSYMTDIIKGCSLTKTVEFLACLKKKPRFLDENISSLCAELKAICPEKVFIFGNAATKLWETRAELSDYTHEKIIHFAAHGGQFEKTYFPLWHKGR